MGKRTNTAVWLEDYKRWQIKVQKDGKRRTFTSSAPGRTGQREANAKADAWLDDGIVGGRRVKDLWRDFLDSTQANSSTSNYKKIECIGNNYILPEIGGLKIDQVTEGHLKKIIDRAYKTGSLKKDHEKNWRKLKPGETLSRKTLLGILATIKSFIKYCRVYCKVTTLNPEGLKIPEGARYKGRSILQPDALSILFREDTTLYRGKRIFDPLIYAYRLAVSAGPRPGEIIGLQCSNVIQGINLQIRRSINIFGEETNGKNQNAIRDFVLPPLAQKAVSDQIKYLKSQSIALNLNTPLFQISNEQAFYRTWKRYCQANGIQPVSLYELRHSFVSIAKYLPEGQVKAIVGHSRSMDTFGVYGHKIKGDDEKTAEAIGAIFEKIIG